MRNSYFLFNISHLLPGAMMVRKSWFTSCVSAHNVMPGRECTRVDVSSVEMNHLYIRIIG